MREFRRLSGLPATGPMPEQFSVDGRGTHREGFVIQFFPEGKAAWVGNFQPGAARYSAVLPHPDGTSVVVIADGQAYVIDPDERRLGGIFGAAIEFALEVPSRQMLVIGDAVGLEAWDSNGLKWRSRRIAWDGMDEVRVESDKLIGEAWSPIDKCSYPFAVDLETGVVEGGSYTDATP